MSDERSVPYYCPYCGGEELRPYDESPGTWECRECLRGFALRRIQKSSTTPDRHEPAGRHLAEERVVVSL